MASGDNGWNSFMQSRQARLVLNALVAVMCAVYAVEAVRELMSGGDPMLVEQVGQTTYLILTGVRGLVCAWVSVVFGRMAYKTLMEKDDE